MMDDVRYSWRLLRRRPGHAVAAAGTLALAIGGTIAIFTLIYGVLFRPLIVPGADRLLVVQQRDAREPQIAGTVDFPQYEDWRTTMPAFSSVTAVATLRSDLTGDATAERVEGQAVSWNFFETLGVPAALGRPFSASDTGTRPIVISDRLWRGRFGADAHVVGRNITVQNARFTVVGVMPPGFERWRGLSDLWVPIEAVTDRRPVLRGYVLYDVVGRLAPGATAAEAAAQATSSVRRREPEWKDRFSASAVPLRSDAVTPQSRRLLVLFTAAVVLVWVIACANVGSLILARTTDRLPEFAVRSALGATVWRLGRQVLAESAVIVTAATAAAWLLAKWALAATIAFGPILAGRDDLVRLDAASAVAAVVLALVTMSAVSSVAMLFLWRRYGRLLRDTRDGGTAAPGRSRLQDALVMIEVAVAVVVMASAGLVVRSLLNLTRVELGFKASSILTMGMSIPSRYPASTAAPEIESVLDTLRGMPGVETAALAWDLPVPNPGHTVSLTLETGARYVNGEVGQRAWTPGRHIVSPDYFSAFGIPILGGRGFLPSDTASAVPVTIISAEMARMHWPGKSPLGQRISNGRRNRRGAIDEPWLTIVGVAADVRYGGAASAMHPQMYVPLAQSPNPNLYVVLKAAGDPLSLISDARRRLGRIDPDIPVFDISTMETRVADAMADARASSTVVSAFALVALALTATGLFASMAGRVARRRRELAIRVALGAEHRHLAWLVLSHAARLIVPSTAAGLLAALASTRLMASQLFELSPADPATLVMSVLAMIAVGGLAAYVPARRAGRVDPMVALREET